MNKIISSRQSGKTRELIKRSAETGYPIVVSNMEEFNRIMSTASSMHLNIPSPIAAYEIIHDNRGRRYDKVIVDNIDTVFETIFSIQFPGFNGFDTVSMTYEEESLLSKIKRKLFRKKPKGGYYCGIRHQNSHLL